MWAVGAISHLLIHGISPRQLDSLTRHNETDFNLWRGMPSVDDPYKRGDANRTGELTWAAYQREASEDAHTTPRVVIDRSVFLFFFLQ